MIGRFADNDELLSGCRLRLIEAKAALRKEFWEGFGHGGSVSKDGDIAH